MRPIACLVLLTFATSACSSFTRPRVRGMATVSDQGCAAQNDCFVRCDGGQLKPDGTARTEDEINCRSRCPATHNQVQVRCMKRCEKHGDNLAQVEQCLVTCPGIVVARGDDAMRDCPEGVLCYDHSRMRSWVSSTLTLVAIAGLVVALGAGIATYEPDSDGDCWLCGPG